MHLYPLLHLPPSPKTPLNLSHFIVKPIKERLASRIQGRRSTTPQVRPLPLAAAHTHVRRVPVNVGQRGKPISARASLFVLCTTRVL